MKNPRLTQRLGGSRRALSPIFATLLLASIVIIFGAVAYYYASNVTTTATNEYVTSVQQNQQSISERVGFEGIFYSPADNSLKIFIINCGTSVDLKISGLLLYNSDHQLVGPAYSSISLLDMSGNIVSSLNSGQEGYFVITTSALSPGAYGVNLITENGGNFVNQFAYTPAPSGIDSQLSKPTMSLGDQPVTVSVTIAGSPAPTGTVNFQVSMDGGATWTTFSPNVPLVAAGGSSSATSSGYAPMSAGTFYFRAVYVPDAFYLGVTSSSNPLTVTAASTTTTLLLNPPGPITLGQTPQFVSATATVSSAAGTPTGTVTFQVSSDGGATWTSFSSFVSLSSGSATSTPYPITVAGTYYFKAAYSGGGNFIGSTSTQVALVANSGGG